MSFGIQTFYMYRLFFHSILLDRIEMTFPKRIFWNYNIVLKTLFSLRRIDKKGNILEITLHKYLGTENRTHV